MGKSVSFQDKVFKIIYLSHKVKALYDMIYPREPYSGQKLSYLQLKLLS